MNDSDTRTAAQADATPPAAGEPQAPGVEIPDPQVRIAELEAELATARDQQLRALADLDNTRRRLERDAQATARYAAENVLRELLGICDSLELGLKAAQAGEGPAQALVEGMELTHRQLQALLEKQGVRAVDPVGEPFNPDAHQAMSMVESAEVPPNHVLSVMQKGYRLHDRLLRPAMVMVAKAPAAPDPA